MGHTHRPAQSLSGPVASRTEAGSVTILALLTLLVVTVLAFGLTNSLLGEIQGGFGSRTAVSSLSVAEAGLHWAGNRLVGPTADTYAGDIDQTLTAAGGQTMGVFDVQVFCVDGVTSPTVNGCAAVTPNQRLIRSSGYVPSKAAPTGQRTLQAVVARNTFFTNAICGYDGVSFDQGVTVEGNVGSEAAMSLAGPPANRSRILATGPGITPPQPGNAYAVTTITCSQGCATQIAGSVNPGQIAGTVCPDRDEVKATYVCTPGAANLVVPTNGTATIDGANRFLNNVTMGRNATVIFDTTGAPGGILEVHVTNIFAGRDTRFLIQGGGKVRLQIQEQLSIGQGGRFGLDFATGNPVVADRMLVRSCSDDNPAPAVHFDQTGQISAILIVPDGTVELDQAQLTDGAILAGTVQFDQGTDFDFDGSAVNVGFGFNTLVTWQDLP